MSHPKPPILVWEFEDAPELYRALSTNGGDEDWVAFVPKEYKDQYIYWLDSGTPFGCCSVDTYEVLDGVIHIGSHA